MAHTLQSPITSNSEGQTVIDLQSIFISTNATSNPVYLPLITYMDSLSTPISNLNTNIESSTIYPHQLHALLSASTNVSVDNLGNTYGLYSPYTPGLIYTLDTNNFSQRGLGTTKQTVINMILRQIEVYFMFKILGANNQANGSNSYIVPKGSYLLQWTPPSNIGNKIQYVTMTEQQLEKLYSFISYYNYGQIVNWKFNSCS